MTEPAPRSPAPKRPTFQAVSRGHAADVVFDQLARAILTGELVVGDALPPERELAEQFGVSRPIARQAVHRLADLSLVRVRQGGATIVQDHRRSTNARVIELRYRLGPMTPEEEQGLKERLYLGGLAIVILAIHRASDEVRAEWHTRVKDFAATNPSEDAAGTFERALWLSVAESTGNYLYVTEIGWWNRLVDERQADAPAILPAPARLAFWTELFRRIAERDDPVRFYYESIRVMLFESPWG